MEGHSIWFNLMEAVVVHVPNYAILRHERHPPLLLLVIKLRNKTQDPGCIYREI